MAPPFPIDPHSITNRTHSPADDGDASDSVAAAAGEAASLEYFQNVVTAQPRPSPSLIEIAKCGCDCWFCPDCCQRKGYNLRARLIPILETFTGLMMLTLTIDPELFASPRDAYLHIRQRRAISVLIQSLHRPGYLHTRRYISVLEFQRATEQVHFHLLVDATRIPKPDIDAAWSKNRPSDAGPLACNRPAFGMTRFSKREFEGGPIHAARYVTKYLVKTPEHGFPAWALDMGIQHRVPRYTTSRGFWNNPPQPSRPPQFIREANPRTYRQRLEECGTSCNIFHHAPRPDAITGETRLHRTWMSRIGVNAEILATIPGLGNPSPRRVLMLADSQRAMIETLQQAAGHPITVLAGIGVGLSSRRPSTERREALP